MADSRVGTTVLGCLSDGSLRNRLQAALRTCTTIEWFDSFASLRRALESQKRLCTAIIDMNDASGESALSFVQAVRAGGGGTAIVACCDLANQDLQSLSMLARAGVHGVLLAGISDEGYAARTIVSGACLGGAGDLVMSTIGTSLPPALTRFVETAVRRPRELRRVADVAAALDVPRQTIGRWCRLNRFVGPEELLMWVRLLLVSAVLESTDRTLESIANEMHYGSPTALRNRIREYTGLTATQIRDGGLNLAAGAFRRRIEGMCTRPETAITER